MATKDHTAIVKGDRIQEGHGRNKRIYRVIDQPARWPDSMCRYGTHVVVTHNGKLVDHQFCYTGSVVVK